MRTMNDVNQIQAYYGGMTAAYLDSIFTSTSIEEVQLQLDKESFSHFCEMMINRSQFSHHEKEYQKRQLKQNLEVFIQGMKDELRAKGRLV